MIWCICQGVSRDVEPKDHGAKGGTDTLTVLTSLTASELSTPVDRLLCGRGEAHAQGY